MVDKQKVENFLQDFGCAKLEQLQILFESKNNNFKSVLSNNNVTRKNDIFVHNTRKINNNMLLALDVLCRYKERKRLGKYYLGYDPVIVSFLNNKNLLYHIIIANEDNKKGIVRKINSYPLSIPKADKLILVFEDGGELENIDCKIPFMYCDYNLEILNKKS